MTDWIISALADLERALEVSIEHEKHDREYMQNMPARLEKYTQEQNKLREGIKALRKIQGASS